VRKDAARLVVALLVVAAAGGCTRGGDDGGTPRPDGATPVARPSSTAEIEILSPQPGEVIEGGRVQVEVGLTGAELLPRATTELAPDEGHMHIALDGETIDILAGLKETIDVEPGTHLVEVEFAAGDHGPFDPRVVQSVTFTVE
jgi:hypothetical protein